MVHPQLGHAVSNAFKMTLLAWLVRVLWGEPENKASQDWNYYYHRRPCPPHQIYPLEELDYKKKKGPY